jgi:arylsulfatase
VSITGVHHKALEESPHEGTTATTVRPGGVSCLGSPNDAFFSLTIPRKELPMHRKMLLLAVLALAAQAHSSHAGPPNIIVIMADDMGYSDLGCYGGEISTPNVDALAAKGLRFTQFYNTSRCCPTRASLLTGLYSHQAGIGDMVNDHGHDAYRGDLNDRCVTLAEAVRPAGYRSFMTGKWHVTKQIGEAGPKDNWPLQRGFDRFYGTISGAGNFFDPQSLVRDNTLISPFDDPEYEPETYYYTHAISDHAVGFIRDHAKENPATPFLMYVAYTSPHWPLHALPQDIAKYKEKYDSGYEPVRQARLARAIAAGVVPEDQSLAPTVGDWDAVPDKAWESAGMEVYAAMIDAMDQGIGRIVTELKKTGQFENTLILYLQDNGGCHETIGRTAKKGHPNGPRPEGPTFPPVSPKAVLERDFFPVQTREGFPIRMGDHVTPGPGDTYLAYGRNWANVSNTPFREYKHWVHEGGISTPLVVSWPAGIDAQRHGEVVHARSHLIDLMPTIMDVTRASYPDTVDGVAIHPMEGVSLRPVFEGKPLERSAPLFWEHEGNKAIRDGRWKLVAKHAKPWELYDIEADRAESRDLVLQQPDLAKRLERAWQGWADRVGVQPYPVASGRTKKRKAITPPETPGSQSPAS